MKKLLLQAALGVATLLLIGLGCECYYRFWCDRSDANANTAVGSRWLAMHYKLNLSGQRDDLQKYMFQAPPGKHRVTFLGDSFTEAQGVPEVSNRFANLVRRAQPDWEVHILAGGGWDTQGERRVLMSRMMRGYQIDVVVLCYVLNDIEGQDPYWSHWARNAQARSKPPGWLFKNSYFLNLVAYRFRQMLSRDQPTQHDFIVGAYNGRALTPHLRELRRLQLLVKRHHGTLAVVTFPMLDSPWKDYPYREIHARLDDFWEAQKVPHLDLLPFLESEPVQKLVANPWDHHPNELAHRIVARAVLRWMQQWPATPFRSYVN